ncbi:TonB-dependent receptor [Methylophilus sp. Leaf408]|uniref:TonB-dependent receptor n=1 Tax=Methylophilus sp. Leaf408 TaxID=2876561 RepID=UPI001E3D5D47|nr:TonB-dependent receptor [Methylophilus sp. Leaf408]
MQVAKTMAPQTSKGTLKVNYIKKYPADQIIRPLFRRTLISIAVAGLSLTAVNPVYAADDQEVNELRQEVERLKQALSRSEKALAEEKSAKPGSEKVDTEPTTIQQPQQAQTTPPEDANELDSLVVTARKKNVLERIKDKPASISIVSGEELDRFQATNITEVLRRVGNVNFNYGNPRTGSLTLRGITTGSSDQIAPTVGVLIDGVGIAYTPLANGYIYTDIDTVDVTRGPQGTAGGLSSNIGRVTFKTKEPTFKPVASVAQTFGEWHTSKTQAVIGGPVIDDLLAWRGSFVREQQEGPFKEQFPDFEGRGSYQNTDRTFGRIQFLLTPSENFNAKLSYELQPKGSEFVNGNTVRHPEPRTFSNGVARPGSNVDTAYNKYVNRAWFNRDPTVWNPSTDYYKYMTNTDNNGAIITSSEGLTANLYLNALGHEFKSITGWRNHWFSASNDEGTPYDITKSGGYITDFKQLSQEFRFNSIKDENSLVDYQGGLLYLKTDNHSLGSRTRYGNDAGAFQANDGLYTSLSASAAGQALLRDSLNLAYKSQNTIVENKSIGANAQADWHLSKPLTLTTGYAVSFEDRSTTQGVFLLDPGVGGDLTTAFGNSATTTTVGGSAAAQAAADRLAQRYFGTTYNDLIDDPLDTANIARANQLRDAARVRNGTLQPGSLYNYRKAKPWDGAVHSAVVTLTDKLSDNISVYGSLQYGEKAGISQMSAAGLAALVDKEKTTGVEFGLRSALLNNELLLNANVYVNEIRDFQTTIATPDANLTLQNASTTSCVGAACQGYSSQVGNVPKVRAKGIELDATYLGLEHFNFRLAAAYNDARYADDAFFAFPSERSTVGLQPSQLFYNAKGDTLVQSPKFTSNLYAGYNLPVFGNYVFHADANYKYFSSYNISTSSYDKVDAYGLLDLGVGIGRRDGLFDANVLVKNAFDKEYNPYGFASYTPSLPRWIGVVFSSKL